MAQGLNEFYTELKARVGATTGALATWAETHFSRPLKVFGADHAGEFQANELPAAVVNNESGEAEVLVVGGGTVEVTTDLEIEFTWHEEQAAEATTQRMELVDAAIKAVMAAPDLNGAVFQANVTGWVWNIEAAEPVQIVTVRVRGTYRLTV